MMVNDVSHHCSRANTYFPMSHAISGQAISLTSALNSAFRRVFGEVTNFPALAQVSPSANIPAAVVGFPSKSAVSMTILGTGIFSKRKNAPMSGIKIFGFFTELLIAWAAPSVDPDPVNRSSRKTTRGNVSTPWTRIVMMFGITLLKSVRNTGMPTYEIFP